VFSFAYDGSINGDWVSHYAVQLAGAHPDRILRLVHVRDGRVEPARLAEKLDRLRLESEHQGVQLETRLLEPESSGRFETLRSALAQGPEHFLICGTPALERRRGCLRGTLSERLLRELQCNVLALRVVHPGLLGSPRRLLVPLDERPEGFQAALPFLQLFGPQLTHLHLMLVARVGHRRLHRLSHAHGERLRGPGLAYCERVEREIIERLGPGARVMDAQVLVSDQVHHEILIAANRTRSRLIYMGVSERGRAERLRHGDPVEQVLRDSTCDVAIYRGIGA
jgi:nucleotide-binding universal stress UspA family protein